MLLDCEVERILLDGDWTMLDVEGISLTGGMALGRVWKEVKLVGWVDFEGTFDLALDSVDVGDWKESHYKLGPVCLSEHADFWNNNISWWIKAIANKETKSWVNQAKGNVYWLQMIYTYTFDLNHATFFLWHMHTHATKDLHFDVFQVQSEVMKSNLSSACLPMSIYWLTTFGFQFTPSKHVG